MNKIEAVLFDLDGTLLDTREFVYKAYHHSLKTFGYPTIKTSEIDKVMGLSLEECYRLFTKIDEIEELCSTHRDFQLRNLDLVKPFDNTIELLSRLRKSGLKTAVVTTRSNKTTGVSLSAAGILNSFDIVIGREDVINTKPDPEALYKAMEALAVDPEKSMMVGDTDADIAAGKNAGVKTVGVIYGYHGDEIRKSKPDYVVDDIIEIARILL